jgi:hypothetical protein
VTDLPRRRHGRRDVVAVVVRRERLPFDNVAGDQEVDYLRLALADEVATALSETPSLAVRPAGSGSRAHALTPRERGRPRLKGAAALH